MTVISCPEKNEQVIKETPEILELVTLAKCRAMNGRKGDRALQKLIELQQSNMRSLIHKRLRNFPYLEWEDLELSAIAGIIKRLESYDPMKGTFSSWAFLGIYHGLDQLCNDHRRNYQAKCSASHHFNPVHEDQEYDIVLWEKVSGFLDKLSDTAQEIISLVCQGWKFTEIGEHLSKSADAVRMMFNRSIQKIKEQLIPIPPAPEFKLTRGWLKQQLFKVVRKYFEHRKQICKPDQIESENFMNTVTPAQNTPRFTKIKQRLGLTLAAGAITTGSIAMIAPPVEAQSCLGYMCGPFGIGIENVFFEDDEETQKGMTGAFSLLQIVLISVVVGLIIWGISRAVKQESYTLPLIIFLIVVLGAFGSNYLGGLLVSQVNDNGIGFVESGGGAEN